MKSENPFEHAKSYVNPVLNRPCADPFVLKYLNEYWCYSTGIQPDGRCFGAFHSRDLVNWRELGGVIDPVEPESTCYWAPEVIYQNGQFIMYYSVGDGNRMHIRVATADGPAGPFFDTGLRLTNEEFAIDPHPYRDQDGTWYLFYATDFLEHTHIGTGTVCDVLLDFTQLKGERRTVVRALYDWQVFDPKRKEKGGVRWHTVEGPFVQRRKGIYYIMFSGGNWRTQSYGVAYAISETLRKQGEWEQIVDGERVLPILRTIPGEIVGPGHNSVVRGPDNLQKFCIYHRWSQDLADRVLSIDRLDWAGERLIVVGATSTPQPAPALATFADFFDERHEKGLGNEWLMKGGEWSVRDNTALQQARNGEFEARSKAKALQFISEVSLKLTDGDDGAVGIRLFKENNSLLTLLLIKDENTCDISWKATGDSLSSQRFVLPGDFNMKAYHLLRIEADSGWVKIVLDDELFHWKQRLVEAPTSVALLTSNAAAAFRGFAFTQGWQNEFTCSESIPSSMSWKTNDDDCWFIAEKDLRYLPRDRRQSTIIKEGLPESYDLVVNAKMCTEVVSDESYGFLPALQGESGPLMTVEKMSDRWVLRSSRYDNDNIFYLPEDFDPFIDNQFRFRKSHDRIVIQYEARILGSVRVPTWATGVGLFASGIVAAFDLVRVTAV
jgi:GH43 family beta-xylosidase